MARKILIYIGLCIVVVLMRNWIHTLVYYIDLSYIKLNLLLKNIFSQSAVGQLIRQTVVFAILPAGLALIPALIYKVVKGRFPDWYIHLTWILWIVVAMSIIVLHRG